ncbi:MAG: formylmethanofuran dehydrogenase subunit A, partial [Planctomycetaceae bacterium]|nr:formylmethanofuran dehydrogenase subunit A [Planctomycetaceae bacterium]
DVTIYQPQDDKQRMFELPRYVIHAGEIVVDDSQILPHSDGKLLHVAPTYDVECVPDIQQWFEANYTIQFRNYPVDPSYLHENEIITSNEQTS